MTDSAHRMIALLVIRIILVVGFQLLAGLILTMNKAVVWWPFSVVATDIVCLVILIALLKKEGESFTSIQFRPFDTLLPGRIPEILNRRSAESRVKVILADLLALVGTLALLGIPAIAFNGFISESVPVLRDTQTIGVLPDWALYLLFVMLPIGQAVVEFPFFYGYVYPRLESYFEDEHENPRLVASVKALSIVLGFFVLQMVLLPIILNPGYILWRAIAFIPLLAVIGVVIRLVPRLMPWLNLIHVLMALGVVLEYWQYR